MYYKKSPVNRASSLEKVTGRGFQYSPMRVNQRTLMNIGVDRITQSLFVILSTPRGTRFFNPDFGTRLYECLFEPNDFIFADSVKYYVTEDIKLWEPRINLKVSVNVIKGTNRAELNVTYMIKGDSTEYNFVYPLNRELHPLGGGVR